MSIWDYNVVSVTSPSLVTVRVEGPRMKDSNRQQLMALTRLRTARRCVFCNEDCQAGVHAFRPITNAANRGDAAHQMCMKFEILAEQKRRDGTLYPPTTPDTAS